ncbi:MAG: phospholipase D-like domain-containing protein, partial [Spirochaetia bacterium]|nr:phospholipase D-like domain-containing protein [Spirochaetota bacterium]MDW8113219.1 phospholipase D-like domain-containing protein [Spirochaetia bacterium]
MSNFITNSKEKTLKQRIHTLISESKELKFIVGFFYFSGIQEIYKELKKLYDEGKLKEEHLKILVGLDIDKNAYGIYEVAKLEKLFNINSAKEDFIKSLKIAFTSGDLDRKEIYEQIDFFIKLLSERKLVIRKTKEPNHAKLYLFKLNNNIIPNLFITGSSNLTKAGLESQNEFNVEIKDYGFEEAEKYFDSLWESSIQLSQEDVVKTLENETFIRKITPLTAYAYLLKLYRDLHKGESSSIKLYKPIEEAGYKTYNYQLDAVYQALENCKTHGGTIIADVVGLGKTVVACATAKVIGKRGIVICPPHLIGDENRKSGWRKYLADFSLRDWEVRSIGKLEETFEFVKNNEDIEIV